MISLDKNVNLLFSLSLLLNSAQLILFLDTTIKYYNMICRIWHGYATNNNADTYENLLKEEIFVGIKNRNIIGYTGIQLLRRQLDLETEFITIMWFDSLDSVKEFAGNDYEKAVVPDKAQKSCHILIRGPNTTKSRNKHLYI
jgi:heme-degrading monooxygenase HmoA